MIAFVAGETLLLVADLAMTLEAVGARGEEVTTVAAVGDALVDREAVLAQVAGISRFVAAGVADVLHALLKKRAKCTVWTKLLQAYLCRCRSVPK